MSCTKGNDIEDNIRMNTRDKNIINISNDKLPKYISFVKDLIREQDTIKTIKDYTKLYSKLRKKYHINPSKVELLYIYNNKFDENDNYSSFNMNYNLRKHLIKTSQRSESGILQITITMPPEWDIEEFDEFGNLIKKTKKFTCKNDCSYCPNEVDEYGNQLQPRSYLSTEPAMLRALQFNFDPIKQFHHRCLSYMSMGHDVSKIELIILGGTFNHYDENFRRKFIKLCYYAANTVFNNTNNDNYNNHRIREISSLEEEIKINETAKCGIIGLTLETRPDMITDAFLRELRDYNCTRVQIGVQHTNDKVLKMNNRGCKLKDTYNAIRRLKGCGFKTVIHLMPDLYGSNPDMDKAMFYQVIYDMNLQADDWKIYPTAVTEFTKLKKLYDLGEYEPYSETNIDLLINLMIEIKPHVSKWIRIERLIRDIPTKSIVAGYNGKTNLRQVIHNKMKKRGLKCKCLRCMELRNKDVDIKSAKLVVVSYNDSFGKEYFISYETCSCSFICFSWLYFNIIYFCYKLIEKILNICNLSDYFNNINHLQDYKGCKNYNACLGFCRLRIDKNPGLGIFEELEESSLVRELHTYGQKIPVSNNINFKNKNNINNNKKIKTGQHIGNGIKMMLKAEEITKRHNLSKISVIAGTNARTYYKNKLNYIKHKSYMIKKINNINDNKNTVNIFTLIIILINICYYMYKC